MHRLESAAQAAEVARALQRPGRTRPALVLSIAARQSEPYVDVDEVEAHLRELCDVYVLPTGPASRAFAEALPEGRQVYGGASRVYSTDLAWVEDQYASTLFFAYSAAEGQRVVDELISEAFAAVHQCRRDQPLPRPSVMEAQGVVQGCIGGRVLVRLEQSPWALPATIRPELVAPGVAGERMFIKGQTVVGTFDSTANRLDPAGHAAPPAEAFADVAPDTVLLGRVSAVGPACATVTLLPGVDVQIPAREIGGGAADATSLVTVGEVLPVHVMTMGAGVPETVTLLAPEYAELAQGVSIFPGGPPWLVAEPRPNTPPAGPDFARAGEGSVEIDPGDPNAPLLLEHASLQQQIRRLTARVSGLEAELATAKTRARAATQRAHEAEKKLSARAAGAWATPGLFSDPSEQFRHEVRVAWAERTTPHDKRQHPLREFAIGPSFLATLNSMEGIDRAKVVEVVADIACGRAEQTPTRAMKALRQGAGPNDPVVTRSVDGATCVRVRLQSKTSSARRLHFWRLPDGAFELSSVRLHDDFRA